MYVVYCSGYDIMQSSCLVGGADGEKMSRSGWLLVKDQYQGWDVGEGKDEQNCGNRMVGSTRTSTAKPRHRSMGSSLAVVGRVQYATIV